MSDTLVTLNAVCQPISALEAPLTGRDWSPVTLSDQIACTNAGTNPQIEVSAPLIVSTSLHTVLFPDAPPQWTGPLFSSSSRTPPRFFAHRSRKARYKDQENLKGWQVNDLFQADAIADNIGLGMDWFITINWLHTSATQDELAKAFQRGCHRMVQWFRQRNLPPVYIYTHENPEGRKPNTHMLIHVPRTLIKAFKVLIGRWFGALNDTAVKVEPRAQSGYTRPERLQYMIKGAHYIVCKSYGGYRKKGGQGPIEFKRSGVCRHLRNEFRGRNDKWGRTIHRRATKLKMLISGEELKALRRQAGLSQIELAALAGIHRNSVNRLENMGLIRGTSGHAVRLVMKALGDQIPEAYRA